MVNNAGVGDVTFLENQAEKIAYIGRYGAFHMNAMKEKAE